MLKKVHDQVMDKAKNMSRKNISKAIEEFSKDFPSKHRGLAINVNRFVSQWSSKVVAELVHGDTEPEILSNLRAEGLVPEVHSEQNTASSHPESSERNTWAVTTKSGFNFVPFDLILLAARVDYYTLSTSRSNKSLQVLFDS